MKKIIFVFVSMLCVLTSCNLADDDGVWDPMELRASTEMDASRNIKVPSTGATIQVTCTNYQTFWMESVLENGNKISQKKLDELSGSWFKLKIKGNMLTAEIYPNNSGKARQLDVGISAGDIFDGVKFYQESN